MAKAVLILKDLPDGNVRFVVKGVPNPCPNPSLAQYLIASAISFLNKEIEKLPQETD